MAKEKMAKKKVEIDYTPNLGLYDEGVENGFNNSQTREIQSDMRHDGANSVRNAENANAGKGNNSSSRANYAANNTSEQNAARSAEFSEQSSAESVGTTKSTDSLDSIKSNESNEAVITLGIQTKSINSSKDFIIDINGYGGFSSKKGIDYKNDGNEIITGVANRVRNNIEALEISAQIAKENRFATSKEQEKIAKFTGWGGLAGIFSDNNESLKNDAQRLENFIRENSANEIEFTRTLGAMHLSSQSAYYTSPLLINTIYKGLEQMGVSDNGIVKKVLEPSCGLGNFLTNSNNSSFKFTGIELEKISYQMTKQLNPSADIKNIGFERFNEKNNFDIVVGNPPYDSDMIIQDSVSRGNGLKIANYFPVKAMEQLRNDGVMAFVMPTAFLDKNGDKHLQRLCESGAEFLGAVRLPNTAFKNSGTEVNTDIVFFRKREKALTNPSILELNFMGKLGADENEKISANFEKYYENLSDEIKFNKTKEQCLSDYQKNFSISEYFLRNPQNILGTFEIEKNRFGEYVPVFKDDGRDLVSELDNFVKTLPKNIFQDIDRSSEMEKSRKFDFVGLKDNGKSFEYIKNIKNGNYFYDFGNSCFARKISNENYELISDLDLWKNSLSERNLNKFEKGEYADNKRQKDTIELKNNLIDYIKLRDNLNILLRAELDSAITDEKLAEFRENLNSNFNKIKERYENKPIEEIFKFCKDDATFSLIANLENKDGSKAKIFSERISKPFLEPKPSTSKEALLASFSLYGKINMDYLDRVLEQDLSKTIEELKRDKLIFLDPKTNNYIEASEYLSGNVKKKYKEAMQKISEGNKEFEQNANALKEVFPPDKKITEINFGLGMNWIPLEIYQDFADYFAKQNDIEGASRRSPFKISRDHNGIDSVEKDLKAGIFDNNRFYENFIKGFKENSSDIFKSYDQVKELCSSEKFERDKIQPLIAFAMNYAFSGKKAIMTMDGGVKLDENGKPVIDKNGKEVRIKAYHKELSDDVNATISNIQDSFVRYVLTNDRYREQIESIFNEVINTDRVRDFSNTQLELFGSNPNIKLRPHQEAGVWRGIKEKSTLLNVNVGGGKTFMGVALAMEQKRMGLINKSAIVVPKHMVGDWAQSFKTLYSNANILALDEKSFSPKNKEKFLANIKINDYDAIIMSKEQFKAIPKNPEATIVKKLQTLAYCKDMQRNSKIKIKNLDKYISKIEKDIEKTEKRAEDISKNKNTTYEELGIDCLIVDEAHNYKNLEFITQKKNVAGLGNAIGSDIAFDMKLVTDDIHDSNNKKLYFLTGTPVANSLCEIYHMQRFLQPNWLKEKGFLNFDNWANTFAKDVADIELGAGGEPKLVTRMSSFDNLRELSSGWGAINFYANNEDIEKAVGENFIPKAEIIKIVAPRSPQLNTFYGEMNDNGQFPEGSLMHRFANPNEKENHPLRLTNLARKAALDFRLIDDRPENDFEKSKINLVVENVIDNYKNNHAEEKGTQIIFCDLSVSKHSLKEVSLEEEQESAKEKQNENAKKEEGDILRDKDGNVIQETYRITYLNGEVETYNINDFIEELKARSVEIPKDISKLKDLEEIEDGKFEMTGFAKIDLASENDKKALEGVSFDVYSDIARKLMKSGIPREEIAFVGDCKTKEQKDELFAKVRSGDIRILIGSTAKMGTGVNVQDRLVALHNVDYPWNPAGFEQRIGRIERQGNKFFEADPNFKPKVYNYSTDRTYDVKVLQLLETKSKSIHQFQEAHKLNINSLEDISTNATNFAEMKAMTAGNPLIFEEFQIENKLGKLEKQFTFWECEKIVTEQKVSKKEKELLINIGKSELLPTLIESNKNADESLESRLGHIVNPKEIVFPGRYDSDEKKYKWGDKVESKKDIIAEAKNLFAARAKSAVSLINNHRMFDLFTYRGLDLFVSSADLKNDFGEKLFTLNVAKKGEYDYIQIPKVKFTSGFMLGDGFTLNYAMRKVDEVIDKFPTMQIELEEEQKKLREEIKNGKNMLENFEKEGFKEQALLDALRSDKKEIAKHIADKNTSWIPSYKSISEKATQKDLTKEVLVGTNNGKEIEPQAKENKDLER